MGESTETRSAWTIPARDEKAKFLSAPVMSAVLLVTGLAAVTGPFDTYSTLSLAGRFVFWFGVVAFGAWVSIVTRNLTLKWTKKLSPFWADLVNFACFTAAYAPLTYLYVVTVYPVLSDYAVNEWVNFGWIFLIVGTISIFSCLSIAVLRRVVVVPAPVEVAPPSPIVVGQPAEWRLLSRLEVPESGALEHMTADDHYIVLNFDNGASHRLLMRFADAVESVPESAGIVTHRSHWVACDQIVEGMRDKGKDYLVLKSGRLVPVSRNYKPILCQNGFTFGQIQRAAE